MSSSSFLVPHSGQFFMLRHDFLTLAQNLLDEFGSLPKYNLTPRAIAATLRVLESWTLAKVNYIERDICNNRTTEYEHSLWIKRTAKEMSQDTFGLFAETTINRVLLWLRSLNLVFHRDDPYDHLDRSGNYLLNIPLITAYMQNGISETRESKFIVSKEYFYLLERVKLPDDLYNRYIVLDIEYPFIASKDAMPSPDESESEQVPKPLSLQEEKTQPVEQSHLSQKDEASAAPPPAKTPKAKTAAKKSKAKTPPKRTRADQDAALEVLMMIGLSGTRNVSLAAKLLKSLDTVVAATFNLDPAAAAAIVSASNLTAFYQWYDTENNDFNRPTGHTLPNWFIQWYRATQSHPATQTRIGSITIPAAINTPTVGYRFCDHDNIYYHHSIINLGVDHYENGIPYTIPNTITIEKD